MLGALGLALVAAGCGGKVTVEQAVNFNAGQQLTIYSSLPLQGPTAATSRAIVDGEKLALGQTGGEIGPLRISYTSLDDSSPRTGQWSSDLAAENAQIAGEDGSTIAYLGDYDSGATAITLPILNSLSILQISPASPYAGFTTPTDAAPGEPATFYPSGRHTFGQLVPGDAVQALAVARFLTQRHVHSLFVIRDSDPAAMDAPLAELVVHAARRADIRIVGNESVASTAALSGDAPLILASHAGAFFYSGGLSPGEGILTGPTALWRALAAADPQMLLVGSSALAVPQFTSLLGASAARTFLATPQLPTSMYGPLAQTVLTEFRHVFGYTAPAAALYGYEAMQSALQAIRDAGADGNDRLAVVDAYFAIRDRDSVLGRYSVLPNGDDTLDYFAFDRVAGGQPVYDTTVHTAAP